MSRNRLRGLAAAVSAVVLLSGMVVAPGSIAAGTVSPAAADDDFATAPYPDWRNTISDSADAATDQWDIFQVYLEDGEVYDFDLVGVGAGENFDLFLYYPETTTLGDTESLFDSSELAGSTETVTGTGDWEGHWYVVVKATSGSGTYSLTGTFTSPDDNVPAVDFTHSPVRGALDSFSNWDTVYRIWLDTGDTLDLTVTLRADPASAAFVPVLYVFPPSTTNVLTDPAAASNLDSTFPKTLSYTATAPGFHYVDMRDAAAGHEWGEFNLAWMVTPVEADWYWQNPLPNAETLNGIDFINGTTGWAVGQFGTIMKSADGGTSWRLLPSGTTVSLQDVCFVDEFNGWAVGAANTILYTTNGGETWTPQVAQGASVTLNAVKMVSATTGWIVGNEGRVLATTNGGSSWVVQTGAGTGTLYDCDFVSTTTGWAVGGAGAVYATTNGGTNWGPQTSGAADALLAVDFIDASHGWAAGVARTSPSTVAQTYYTSNGGATWTPVRVVLPDSRVVNFNDVRFLDALHGWAACDVYGNGFILETINGGVTWTAPVLGQGEPLRAVDATDDATGFAAGDAGMVWGTVDGTAWSLTRDQNRQFSIYDLQFRGTSLGWAVGTDGRGLTTTDGGATWTPRVVDSTGGTLSAVSFFDDTHGIAVGEGGRIATTADGGVTWAPRNSGTLFLRGVWFQSSTLAWAVGNSGTILKSTNGGENWGPQATGVASTLQDVRFATDDVGWAVGQVTILKTTDGGATWTPQTTALAGSLDSIYVLDSDHAWICGTYGVQYTSDGGTTWTRQLSLSNAKDIGFADANNGWVVGSSGLIYRTADGGTTWRPEFFTRGSLEALAVTGTSAAWAAGDGGAIIATADASPLVGTFVLNDGAAYQNQVANPGPPALGTLKLHSYVPLATGMSYRLDHGSGWGASTPVGPGYVPSYEIDVPTDTWAVEVTYTDGVHPPLVLQDSIIVDVNAPTAPAVTVTPLSANSVRVAWSGATDVGTGIAAYNVYVGSTHVATSTGSNTVVSGLAANTLYTFSVRAVDAAGLVSTAGTANATTLALVPVYRFFNLGTGTHLYTSSEAEKNHIIATWPTTMRDEGLAYYYDPGTDTATLHRLFNLQTGTHFYTASPTELNNVLTTWPTIFRYEGPAYPVSIGPSGTKTTVYRFFNLQTNTHFYTGSAAEADHVKATWPTTMRYEGPAFYVGQ